jgi:hypothetical protein
LIAPEVFSTIPNCFALNYYFIFHTIPDLSKKKLGYAFNLLGRKIGPILPQQYGKM